MNAWAGGYYEYPPARFDPRTARNRVMAHPTLLPVIVPTQTIRRGQIVDVEARCRWLKRPESRPIGWHNAVLE